jgi:hypothetical protein
MDEGALKMALPDLSRTEAALSEYDAFDSTFKAEGSQDKVIAAFAALESRARAVGRAYGLETADRNNVSTCEMVIRPGPAVPGPGCTLSFVRRMVAQWKQQTYSCACHAPLCEGNCNGRSETMGGVCDACAEDCRASA